MAGSDDVDFCTQPTQTLVRKQLQVPVGHVVVSGRWRNSDIVASLQGKVNVLFEDSLGVVDFHPAGHVGVVYISEADLITASGYKRKLAKLRKAGQIQREAAGILVQMVHAESKLETNPFCRSKKQPSLDVALLRTLQCVPKLGEVKARLLLEKFHSLSAISRATIEDLARVIGKANAQHVKNFFG
ncbi:hypothetical protein ScPMuIL_003745 [Solemya velum]